MAAEKEAAVVFPPFYFGQIYEARCFPGALTLRPTLLLDVIQSVLDEIGRNGLHKIVLLNGHGGNTHLLSFLAQSTLWEEKPYAVYVPSRGLTPERQTVWNQTIETALHGHACECETSISLANHEHLVHMDRVPDDAGAGAPLERLKEMPPTFSGVSWYADYPEHYAGDARSATAEKGEVLRGLMVDTLAEYIAAVKADEVVPALNRDFFARVRQIGDRTGM
jgi:creatinine amidohydrolase